VLGHLAAFGIEDQAQADDILEGRTIEQKRGDGVQGVKPAPGLIHGLADIIGGELLFEGFKIFKGVVPLGNRHGA